MLLLVFLVAALLRFWQLGDLPPGLYRDEAWNGLDALKVLEGELSLYFFSNNGREPTYIYLVALSIWLLGRSALALRLGAAVVSTLTTLTTYQLGKVWFGWRTGLLAAWLWATTVWPLHLGRIGLRAVLLPFYLSLSFWLGTWAYRKPAWWRWLIVGVVYGLSFYTYLAVRFTPVILVGVGVYGWWRGRRMALRLAVPWFTLGAGLTLVPLFVLSLQHPEIISGRAGQVSLLSPAINQGDLWGTLALHIWQALGLFFGQGDTILRHNPPGRPLFDLFMVGPFLIGMWVCWQKRHRGVVVVLWLWLFLMLWPTILAEDTPHFLRGVGILPVALLVPAIGLSQLSSWNKLHSRLRLGFVVALCGASALVSVYDYFWVYARQPDTAYLFEAAARDMAEAVQAESEETTVFIDQRLWEGWPSIPFLLEGTRAIYLFHPEEGLPIAPGNEFVIYLWPYAPRDFLTAIFPPTATLTIEQGSLARGDLDPTPLPFAVRYQVQPTKSNLPVLAQFGGQLLLHEAHYRPLSMNQLEVTLAWTVTRPITQELKLFVHLLADDTIIGQWDGPPGQGYWLNEAWPPELVLRDRIVIPVTVPLDMAEQAIYIGVYDNQTLVRLPVVGEDEDISEDRWRLR
ncbi:MAG: glycosyltransferase family 39 protein [Chloroflexi bacterium]|nr:glycosyltransferase family 39 protein [Chloroflexota bacterium]MBP8058204.1 glycosyltransferase family 39 protein [Chloroflexota bacterium]